MRETRYSALVRVRLLPLMLMRRRAGDLAGARALERRIARAVDRHLIAVGLRTGKSDA